MQNDLASVRTAVPGGGQAAPSHQQAAAASQQAQAQLAVSQAVQQAMQQRGQAGGSGQALTDLAVNYMSAISNANAQTAAANAARGGVQMQQQAQQAAQQQAMQPQQAGPQPGQPGWDPRQALSYPTMMYMNNLNASMQSMPNLLAMQQQRAAQMAAAGQHPGQMYTMMDPNAQYMMSQEHRRARHIKAPNQLKALKAFFATNPRPNKEEVRRLVKECSLNHSEVTRWFRNERHKQKKSQDGKHDGMPNPYGMPQQQHAHKRKRREDGMDGSETDGSDDEHHNASFGLGSVNPPQRIAFIQSFLSSLSDPTELDAAERTLDAKRAAMGSVPFVSNDPSNAADGLWHVLQQQFHAVLGVKGEDGKPKLAGGAAAASMQPGPNGTESIMLQGLTQMFARHSAYLPELSKALGMHQQMQQMQQQQQQLQQQ